MRLPFVKRLLSALLLAALAVIGAWAFLVMP
jgi:hypothetical protein